MRIPGNRLWLDIADLYRDSVTIPVAFRAAKKVMKEAAGANIERVTRRECGRTLSRERTIPKMIDRIKALFDEIEESVSAGRVTMPMTVVVTRDVEPRYRGFLASAMLEIAPGVYVSAGSFRRRARACLGRARRLVHDARERRGRDDLA